MSHGASDKCEPNLVPLLDLVLQLVMFFMVCSNFIMEQINETIKLPVAIAAQPIKPNEEYIMFLNINKEGVVLLSPLDAVGENKELTNGPQIVRYMKKRYEEDMKHAKPGEKDKGPRTLIILRADKEAAFEKVYAVEKACQQAGYLRVQVRTIRG